MKLIIYILKYLNILVIINFSWNVFNKYKFILNIFTYSIITILFTLGIKKGIVKKGLGNKIICILLPLLMIFSFVYSINMDKTLESGIKMFMISIYAITLCKVYDKRNIYSILKTYFIISILISIISILVFPSKSMMLYQGDMVAKGVFAHKNVLARNMIIAIIIFINDWLYLGKIKFRNINIVFILLSIYLIYISKSTTGLLYSIIFMIISVLLNKRKLSKKIYIKIIYSVSIIFNILVYIISQPYLQEKLQNIIIFGKNLTFTGRSDIWNFSFEHIFDKIFFGYGYNGFWNSEFLDIFTLKYNFSPPHSHNGYLNLLLDGGIIILLCVCIIIYICINNNYINNSYVNNISLILISFIIVINLTESTFVELFWFLLVMNCCKRENINSN